jgi:hypothetical protein
LGSPKIRVAATLSHAAQRARFAERVAAVAPIIRKLYAAGVTSYTDVANRLNAANIPTYGPHRGRTRPGGPSWNTAIVRKIMQQLGLPDPKPRRAKRHTPRPARPSTAQRDAAIAPVIREIIASGASNYHTIAAALNAMSHPTHSGHGQWHPQTLLRIMPRLGLSSSCASGGGHRKKPRQPWSPETHRGNSRPLGWQLAEGGKGLIEDVKEQAAIATIRELRAAGRSYSAIARQISTQHGITLGDSTVMRILDRAAGVAAQRSDSRRNKPHRVPDYSARSARRTADVAARTAAGDSAIAPVIRDLLNSGAGSLGDIVASLNAANIPTYSKRGHWHQATVLHVMQRLGLSSPWSGPAKNPRRPWQPPAKSEARSGRPAFGWRRTEDGFIEDATEQAVITAVCNMRAAGFSYSAIARQIREQHGVTLGTATIMRILDHAIGVTAQR